MLRPGIRRAFSLGLRRRDIVRREIREELEQHLELSVDRLVRLGHTPADARAEAMRRLGNVDHVTDRLYATAFHREQRMRLLEWADTVSRDSRYALRGLRRQPALTAVVVVTLALGIGVNAAIFPIVDRLLFRPPAGVAAPDELRRVNRLYESRAARTEASRVFSYPEFADLSDGLRGMAEVAAYTTSMVSVEADTASDRRVGIAYVTPNFFSLLGVRLLRGRSFTEEENRLQQPQLVAIISHDVWMARLGGDPGVLSKEIRFGSRRFTVVGIAAPGFEGIDLNPTGVWVPIAAQRNISAPNGWWTTRNASAMRLVTRRRPGVDVGTIESVGTRRYSDGVRDAGLPDRGATILLSPILESLGPQKPTQDRLIATRLAGVSVVLLLIAIANVTNLLLARGAQRQREIAVRRALGSSGRRLVLRFVAEATCYAVLAAATAALCSALLSGVIRRLLLPNVSWTPPMVDARAIAFTAALAGLCALAAGVFPGLQALRGELAHPLRTAGRDGSGRAAWLRTSLLVTQAALSVVLLVGAGLFIVSLERVRNADPGYQLDRLVAVTWTDPARAQSLVAGTPENRGTGGIGSLAAIEAIRTRVAAFPGVEAVAMSRSAPLRGFSIQGTFIPGVDSAFTPSMNAVSPEFFRTTGLAVLRGRAFDANDRRGAPAVVIVNEEAARIIWPGRDPMGECIRFGTATGPCTTVVGIAHNSRRNRLVEDPTAQVFVPLEQYTSADGAAPRALVIRTSAEPAAAVRAAQQEVASTLGSAATTSTFFYRDWIEPELRPWRLGARLFTGVASLSLILAVVGLYSVLAYSVAQRRHEIGVRIALGAHQSDVVGLVVRQGMRAVVTGLAAGLVLAAIGGKVVASLLYDTSPRDPIVYAAVAVTLLVAAIIASMVPAMRAGRVDPVDALRAE
jgi:predicted permease